MLSAMIRHGIVYLLMFTSSTCFGYTKLIEEEYRNFKVLKESNAVFSFSPMGVVETSEIIAEKKEIFDDLLYTVDHEGGSRNEGRVSCFQFEKTRKLKTNEDSEGSSEEQLRYHVAAVEVIGSKHGMYRLTLDEFGVAECARSSIENMFKVLEKDENTYSLSFKDTDNKCLTRTIKVIESTESSMMVFVDRSATVECSSSDMDDLKNSPGYVLPKSWLKEGKLLHGTGLSFKGEKIKIVSAPKKYRKTSYIVCFPVVIDDQEFNIALIYINYYLMDNIIVKTCSVKSLQSSIMIEFILEDAGKTEVRMSYESAWGFCFKRHYCGTRLPAEVFGTALYFIEINSVSRQLVANVPCDGMWKKAKAKFFQLFEGVKESLRSCKTGN